MTGRQKQSKDKVLMKASLINIFIDIETMYTVIFFFFPGLTKARLKKMRLVFSFLRVVPSDKCYICTCFFYVDLQYTLVKKHHKAFFFKLLYFVVFRNWYIQEFMEIISQNRVIIILLKFYMYFDNFRKRK